MSNYCADRPKTFKRGAFSSWIENSGFSGGQFDNLRGITMVIQAGLTTIALNQIDDYRAVKGEFLDELRSVVNGLECRSLVQGTLNVVLDASSVSLLPSSAPPPAPEKKEQGL